MHGGEGSFIYKTSALKVTHGNFPQALCFSLAMSSEVQQGKFILQLDFCLKVNWAISLFQFCWLDLFQFLFMTLLYSVDFVSCACLTLAMRHFLFSVKGNTFIFLKYRKSLSYMLHKMFQLFFQGKVCQCSTKQKKLVWKGSCF